MSNGSEHIAEKASNAIPDEVLNAAAQRLWDIDSTGPDAAWDDLASSFRASLMTQVEAACQPVAEWARKEALAADNFASMRSRIAALEAVIRRMGDATDARHGSKLERLDTIAALSVAAPSTVLDQVIREAKAEGWDEGASDGQWNAEHEAMIERGNREAVMNPYRNGVA